MNKKNITIIATGGTIAGRGSLGKSANYEAGTFDVEEIVKSIPQIRDLANLNTIQLYNVDSNDMGLDKWIELRKICHELEKNRYVDGIVITHGTDTLEETAFFLNLTLACHKPVVLTGSMRPATATSADGPMNLYQAVALACHMEAWQAGVLDELNAELQVREDLKNGNTLQPRYYISDAKGVDERRFIKQGTESIKTSYGTFNTIKVVLQHSKPERNTVFWLAPKLDYLPVKVTHNDGKSSYGLLLTGYSGKTN